MRQREDHRSSRTWGGVSALAVIPPGATGCIPRDTSQIADRDFRDSPVLFVYGDRDPSCAGNEPPVPEAAAVGLSNCAYKFDALRAAIDAQPDSPHQLRALPPDGHVPTNLEGDANDIVDEFITSVLATDPPDFGAN